MFTYCICCFSAFAVCTYTWKLQFACLFLKNTSLFSCKKWKSKIFQEFWKGNTILVKRKLSEWVSKREQFVVLIKNHFTIGVVGQSEILWDFWSKLIKKQKIFFFFFKWKGRVGIKLIKAIQKKLKKKVTKLFGWISEGGIHVIAKKLE